MYIDALKFHINSLINFRANNFIEIWNIENRWFLEKVLFMCFFSKLHLHHQLLL